MRPVDASCDVDVETYDADEAAVMTVLVLGPLSSLSSAGSANHRRGEEQRGRIDHLLKSTNYTDYIVAERRI